jgi:hypothetical protein
MESLGLVMPEFAFAVGWSSELLMSSRNVSLPVLDCALRVLKSGVGFPLLV